LIFSDMRNVLYFAVFGALLSLSLAAISGAVRNGLDTNEHPAVVIHPSQHVAVPSDVSTQVDLISNFMSVIRDGSELNNAAKTDACLALYQREAVQVLNFLRQPN